MTAKKRSTTRKAATAAVLNPGSIAGIGGAVTALGVVLDPGNADTWAKIGGSVSVLATLVASIFGVIGNRSGS